MAERTDELTRTRPSRASHQEESDTSRLSRLRPRAPRLTRLFDPKFFLLALVGTLVGLFIGGAVLPFGPLGSLAGLAVVAFLLGLIADGRRYLEIGAAGALVSGVSALLGNLLLTAMGLGVPVAVFSAGAGFGLAIAGFYIGRDLKDGFTREL
ncbi:hypothetical protein [Haladaptatus sp. DJG-WS-42]|uniref:hypothetical protein n=1 Tax=Haladaptatus sp. DJG-WS-42 TaxID=3120516 RepID=UPI0030D4FBB3